MSDAEEEIAADEPQEEEPVDEPVEEPTGDEDAGEDEPQEAPSKRTPRPSASPRPRASPCPSGGDHHYPASWTRPTPIAKKEHAPIFSAGKPSKFAKEKLMASEGIVPNQSGSNKYDSQKGMTGFGVPRDVNQVSKTKDTINKEITDEKKIGELKTSERMQSGTNKFASQKGSGGFGKIRDVLNKTTGTGGVTEELPEEKVKASDGIIPLQMGTNKLASQAGMTGMGMPRILWADVKKNPDQARDSQGFIHLQMGTNKFADQSNQQVHFSMPRNQVSHARDEARPPIPHDETHISNQTTGWKDGASQAGSRGFSARRPETSLQHEHQDRKSQGLIPYQMGINWGDSQAGKTPFSCPRQVMTQFTDDKRPELPDELARMPYVPFWSGAEEFRGQGGSTAPGTARDVCGKMVRRLW